MGLQFLSISQLRAAKNKGLSAITRSKIYLLLGRHGDVSHLEFYDSQSWNVTELLDALRAVSSFEPDLVGDLFWDSGLCLPKLDHITFRSITFRRIEAEGYDEHEEEEIQHIVDLVNWRSERKCPIRHITIRNCVNLSSKMVEDLKRGIPSVEVKWDGSLKKTTILPFPPFPSRVNVEALGSVFDDDKL